MAKVVIHKAGMLNTAYKTEDGFSWTVYNEPANRVVGAWGVHGSSYNVADDVSFDRSQATSAQATSNQATPESPLDRLMRTTFEKMQQIMRSKGREYDGGGSDRLGNFRRNAASMGVSMETVLMVYAEKHWGAIQSYVRNGNKVFSNEGIEERVKDLMNYMLLLLLMVEERKQRNQEVGQGEKV